MQIKFYQELGGSWNFNSQIVPPGNIIMIEYPESDELNFEFITQDNSFLRGDTSNHIFIPNLKINDILDINGNPYLSIDELRVATTGFFFTSGSSPFIPGYIPEDVRNKIISWKIPTTNTNYPSEKLVKDSLDLKETKHNLDVEILHQSATDIFTYAHGSLIINDQIFLTEREDWLGTTQLIKFNDIDDLSDYETKNISSGIETICYDALNDRIWWVGGTYNMLTWITPDDIHTLHNIMPLPTVQFGVSPAIITDGEYVYGITYNGGCSLFKINISTGVSQQYSTGLNYGHAGKISTDRLHGYFTTVDGHFLKVLLSDMSFEILDISADILLPTDAFGLYDNNGTDICYVGGETTNSTHGMVVVDTETLTHYMVSCLPTYDVVVYQSKVYSCGKNGFIQVWNVNDMNNPDTYNMTGYVPNELLFSSTGRVFMTNWKSPDSSLSEISINSAYDTLLTKEIILNKLDLKEDRGNKVSEFQATPDDTHYPSEKLVKDSLDYKASDNNTINFDTNIEPTQTGIVSKTVLWVLQYLSQSINWLKIITVKKGDLEVNYGYGYLYTGCVAVDSRVLANGWHVPTETEIETLVSFVGGHAIAGKYLKSSIDTPDIYGWEFSNGNSGENRYGFNIKPSGRSFSEGQQYSYIWSSTNSSTPRYLVFRHNYNSTYISLASSFYIRPIRLIRDNDTGWYHGMQVLIDGRYYDTVKIGTQIWLAQNLATTKFANGDSIPEYIQPPNLDSFGVNIPAYCKYHNDESLSWLDSNEKKENKKDRIQVFTPTEGQTEFTVTAFILVEGKFQVFQGGVEQTDNIEPFNNQIITFFGATEGTPLRVINLS